MTFVGAQVKEFCTYGTKDECRRVWISESEGCAEKWTCHRLHFRKIIQSHTDESLGDCSFLNTCFHMETCKYVTILTHCKMFISIFMVYRLLTSRFTTRWTRRLKSRVTLNPLCSVRLR